LEVGPNPNAGKSLGSKASLLEEIDGALLSPDGCTRREEIFPYIPLAAVVKALAAAA
jgi:hypothetical protein